MRETPPAHYRDRYRSCWCKGWNWEFVGDKASTPPTIFLTLFEYTDEVKGDYRTFHIGDMIKNQYFSSEHWCVQCGLIRLLPENKYHNIDEAWLR